MNRSDLERELRERERELSKLRIEEQASKLARARIWAHCTAFWSGVLTIAGLTGAWMESNSKAVAAAFHAFWEVWGK